MNKKREKRIVLFLTTFITLAVALVIVLKFSSDKSKASTLGYFNTYSNVVGIELDSGYTSAQAMNICNNMAYHIKVANSGTVNEGKARIWAYDLKNNKNYVVYNGNTSNKVFSIGHANCMYVGTNSLYIATQESGKASIYNYKIGKSNGKYYLYNKKEYKLYSHNTNVTAPIACTGINYASELGGFIVKNGHHIYLGKFSGDKFAWTKHYTIDTKLKVNTNKGTENIDVTNYIKQGMFYRGGKLYMPMTNNKKKNQSIIVVYNLNANTKNNSVIPEFSTEFFRITSSTYSKLFEIESVARHNGELYMNVNATDAYGKNHDRIIKMKNFSF